MSKTSKKHEQFRKQAYKSSANDKEASNLISIKEFIKGKTASFEVLNYISQMSDELGNMACKDDRSYLAHLLALAGTEARAEARRLALAWAGSAEKHI
jgi:hypothetical protein